MYLIKAILSPKTVEMKEDILHALCLFFVSMSVKEWFTFILGTIATILIIINHLHKIIKDVREDYDGKWSNYFMSFKSIKNGKKQSRKN